MNKYAQIYIEEFNKQAGVGKGLLKGLGILAGGLGVGAGATAVAAPKIDSWVEQHGRAMGEAAAGKALHTFGEGFKNMPNMPTTPRQGSDLLNRFNDTQKGIFSTLVNGMNKQMPSLNGDLPTPFRNVNKDMVNELNSNSPRNSTTHYMGPGGLHKAQPSSAADIARLYINGGKGGLTNGDGTPLSSVNKNSAPSFDWTKATQM